MKTQATILSLLICFLSTAQLPVSTSPQNKKFVLEEYTGINCSFCPEGHLFADQIYNANPTNVIVINIHPPNAFGDPLWPGDVDLRVPDGIAIHNNFWINSYPCGSINRTPMFGPIATTRYNWAAGASSIQSQPSYCNIALQGTVNVNTRVLTVQAQVYYTGSSPTATNYLNVMLLENKIPARQANAAFYYPANINPDGSYNHDHALRKVITNTFGDPIIPTTVGSTYNTTLTYTIPQTYGVAPYDYTCMLGRLELVAFVTQETKTISINGARGPIYMTGFANSLDIGTGQVKNDAQVCEAKLSSSFKFVNYGSSTVTSAVFSYSANGIPMPNYTWTGSVGPMNQSQTINLPVANFSPISNNTLQIGVVSVNSMADQNPANNITTISSIPQTTFTASNYSMQMVFVQDQYGNESQWKVYDEFSNAIISSDGPFPNLGSQGTATVTKNFSVLPGKCYKLVVTDDVGNGINTSYGSGNYKLLSGATPIYTSNGNYYSGESVWFKSASIAGLGDQLSSINEAEVFPNPASDKVRIGLKLNNAESIGIEVFNSLGQSVVSEKVNFNGGISDHEINTRDWKAGVYHVRINSSGGTVLRKLIVSH